MFYKCTIALLFISFCLSEISAQQEVYFNDTNLDRKDIQVEKTIQGVTVESEFISMTRLNSMRSFPLNACYFREDRIAPLISMYTYAGLQNQFNRTKSIHIDEDGYEVVSEHFSQHYYNLSVFIGTELRWYFDFRQRYIKNRQTVNNSGWFASIPFTFYTVLYTQSETESRTAHFELAAKIGYRYAFNEHWHIEASLSYIPARIGFYNTIGCSFETSNNLKDMFRLELKAAYVFD